MMEYRVRTTKLKLFQTILGALICLGSFFSYAQTNNAEKPNIIFILVDDQRFDSLGVAGHPVLKTPTIDRLAKKGVRFENAVVSTSICMASRATIFTGLTQRTLGYRPADPQGTTYVSKENLNASFPTLLRKNGYHTGFYGKNHVQYQMGNEKAFATMFDDFKIIEQKWHQQEDGTRRHYDEILGDRSVNFLKNRPKNKPFFLYMSFHSAHAVDRNKEPGIGHYPWPKSVDGLYENVKIDRPVLDDPSIFENLAPRLKESLNRQRYFWRWDTLEKYDTNMRAMFRMITGMDNIVKRTLSTIEDQAVRDNTVVIYTADNGYYMGERGLAGKWSHFNESMRVPLIISDPRLLPKHHGYVPTEQVMNIDIPSTILDFAELEIPSQYQGYSLRPFTTGHAPDNWRTFTFNEHHQLGKYIPAWAGIRTDKYVYARYDRQKPDYEYLHDMTKDPKQLINFAKDPEYQSILKAMRAKTDMMLDKYSQ